MLKFKSTSLWREAFDSSSGTSAGDNGELRSQLATALDDFRSRAALLAEEIPRHLPQLTDHTVRHMDAIWDIADRIAGSDVKMNPLEGFVFGGAVLLHDLGNAVAAFPRGVDSLKGREWDDLVISVLIERLQRRPTDDERTTLFSTVADEVLMRRLRQEHARAAEVLAVQGFVPIDRPDTREYLISNSDIRDELGSIIGRIANSHHWPIERVERDFAGRYETYSRAPKDWVVDVLKVACLLRATDAAHVDLRRAPTFQMAIRQPAGESLKHWSAQNHIKVPITKPETQEIEYRSTRPFGIADRLSWWLAYDLLSSITHRELINVDAVLRRNRKFRFAARSVTGIDSPESLSKYIETEGWKPINVSVRITDVVGVIDRFGGRRLYGNDERAPIRELIANAADAIRARRALPNGGLPSYEGKIEVRVSSDSDGHWLEVTDGGVGMSEAVLRGPLLDFGVSYWASPLVVTEFPGLISSGFRPSGQFGIGFFSVFMLASRVRVTTCRHNVGQDQTLILELDKVSPFPTLRSPAKDRQNEILPGGGTRVRLWLGQDPWREGGVFATKDPDRRLDRLASVVGAIAPTLDVGVYVALDQSPAVQVIAPDDWKTIPFHQLLNRITEKEPSFQKTRQFLVCEPRVEGKMAGRFRLLGRLAGTCFLTVDGLFAQKVTAHCEGLLLASTPTLSRSAAFPVMTHESLRSELENAVMAGFQTFNSDGASLAALCLKYGLAPGDIPCFDSVERGIITFDELVEWAKECPAGHEFVILNDNSFSYDDDFGGTSDVPIFGQDNLTIDNNVILAEGIRSDFLSGVSLAGELPAKNSAVPGTLEDLALAAIAQGWECSIEELDTGEVFGEIASFSRNSSDRIETITKRVVVVSRPNGEEEATSPIIDTTK